MRYPLATDLKSRTGAPDRDARQTNAYIEVKGNQSVVRKRPCAQGGVSVGTGTAQGGIGLNIAGVDYIYTVNVDTGALDTLATAGTSWSSGASYSVGDHVSYGFSDYWALTDNSNSNPSSNPSDWSSVYVPAVPVTTYATWNPATLWAADIIYTNPVLSGGDLTVSGVETTGGGAVSTIGKSSGKWYWEITRNTSSDLINLAVGVVGSAPTSGSSWGLGNFGHAWLYYDGDDAPDSYKAYNGSTALYATACGINDVIGVALDMDAGTIKFYKNGVDLGVAYSGLTGTKYAVFDTRNVESITANFGASAFAYSVPSGYNSGLYT